MIEPDFYMVTFEFKDGGIRKMKMTDIDVDVMYDKLWGRDPILWLNTEDELINLDEVRHIKYIEIEEENYGY